MNQPETPRLLIVVNSIYFFLSHRLPIAEAAMARGFEVHVAGEFEQPSEAAELRMRGIHFHELETARGSVRVGRGLRLALRLLRLYRRIRPDIVHHVTAKPVIFGSLAARLMPRMAVVNAVSGLGYAFASRDLLARFLKLPMRTAYRVSMTGRRTHGIFQNETDAATVMGYRKKTPQTHIIGGSGVDLRRFQPTPEPRSAPTILLPARMLRDKGVIEYCEAASLVMRKVPSARFLMAGRLDRGNPAALSYSEVEGLCRTHGVVWLGESAEMPELMAAAHVICLPSYREGAPKALIEACASARAIVTTNVPGCSSVVVDGVNGLLVPPRDSRRLADGIERLLADDELRARMGGEGRKRAESLFGVNAVVQCTLSIYQQALRER
jgi:glycosyltransferase involved in cell wall biosynthesis